MGDSALLEQPSTPAGGLLEPYQRYDHEIARRVVEAYSEGKSLRRIAKMPGMPCRMTIRCWQEENADFRTILAYARSNKADFHAERGQSRLNRVDPDSPFGSARVSLAREQAGYDKWLAGAYDRDTYGERPAQVNVQVNPTVAVAFTKMLGRVEGE